MKQPAVSKSTPAQQNITSGRARNEGLDLLKGICAFLVVTIHCPMIPGIAGEIVTAVNRIAVPVFFMITGWFYETTVLRGREKGQIIKVLRLVIWSSLFYFVFNGLIAAVNGQLPDYFRSYLSIKTFVLFFALTASPFHGHLWYLSALLYVLILVGWFDRRFGRRKLYWLIPLLLLCDLIIGKYSLLLWGREFPQSLVRNWVFVGMPYFLLGDCMAFNQDRIIAFVSEKKILTSVFFIVFVLTTLLEEYLLVSAGLNAERNHYISSTFLSITAFALAVQYKGRAMGIGAWLAGVGLKYSTMIYILHPAFITLFSLVLERLFSASSTIIYVYHWICPILVFFVSLGYSVLHEKTKTVLLSYNR